jgi:hypothetical protein
MATRTKADRQAAAKKAAATRQRNQVRARSRQQGHKAASSRQRNEAASALDQATSRAKGAVTGLGNAGKLVGTAALKAGKSVASLAAAAGRR